jgi:hypothetical protein
MSILNRTMYIDRPARLHLHIYNYDQFPPEMFSLETMSRKVIEQMDAKFNPRNFEVSDGENGDLIFSLTVDARIIPKDGETYSVILRKLRDIVQDETGYTTLVSIKEFFILLRYDEESPE